MTETDSDIVTKTSWEKKEQNTKRVITAAEDFLVSWDSSGMLKCGMRDWRKKWNDQQQWEGGFGQRERAPWTCHFRNIVFFSFYFYLLSLCKFERQMSTNIRVFSYVLTIPAQFSHSHLHQGLSMPHLDPKGTLWHLSRSAIYLFIYVCIREV